MVKSGQAVACTFTTRAASGSIMDADALPTATLHVNGAASAEVVSVTNIRAGVYRASVTLPALSAGDIVELLVAATVEGISDEAVVWSEIGDTVRLSDSTPQTGDSYARIGANGAGLTALATASALTTLAGYLDTEVAAILAAVDTEVAAIKAKTDSLPSDPADQSAVEAAITAAQVALAALIAALNDLSLAEVEDAIAAGSGATPATFWTYDGPRTITQSGQQVAAAIVEGTAISVRRGDRVTINLTGLGSLVGRTALWFTVKARPESETDAQAKVQVTEDDGLVRLNGAAAGDAAGASIEVTNEAAGNLTITLAEETMAALAVGGAWRWDVQVDQPSPGVWTPREGNFTVRADVTRATE